jgi:hypothetical protein
MVIGKDAVIVIIVAVTIKVHDFLVWILHVSCTKKLKSEKVPISRRWGFRKLRNEKTEKVIHSYIRGVKQQNYILGVLVGTVVSQNWALKTY